MKIDAQDVPFSKIVPMPEQAGQKPGKQQKRWYAPLLSPLWLCLLIAFLLRTWLIVRTHGVIDGDEALVGIQAQHILHGQFPMYFYQQPYMGSLEAYLMALIFAVTGSSVWALKAELLLVSLLVVGLTWRIAQVLADFAHLPMYARRWFTLLATLLAAVSPLYDTLLELRALGGYVETYALMLLLLLSTLRLTQRWQASASTRELTLRWAGIGFIVGLGFWVNALIANAVFCAVLWIAGYCIFAIIRHRKQAASDGNVQFWRFAKQLCLVMAAVPAALVGFLPALLWGASHNWANITYILHLGNGGISRQRLPVIGRVTNIYFTCVSPRVIGGGTPYEQGLSSIIHTPLFLFNLICIGTTVGLIVLATIRRSSPLLAGVQKLAALPTLFALCCALTFCVSSISVSELIGCGLDAAGRYATPFMLSIPFFTATVLTALVMSGLEQRPAVQALAEKTAPTPSALRFSFNGRTGIAWFVQALLLLLSVSYLGMQVWTYGLVDAGEAFQSNYCRQNPANNNPILTYMEQQHIRYFWAPNLLGYPFVFKTNSAIIGSDPLGLLPATHTVNRIPSNTDKVLHADRPTMLIVIPHNDTYPRFLHILDTEHVTYHAARFPSQPGFDVLLVTPLNHTVSPLDANKFAFFFCTAQ